jgi:tetratricopeptide (TPR) repeat protein
LEMLAEAARKHPPHAVTLPGLGLGGLVLAQLDPHLVSALDLLEAPMVPARGWIPLRLAESLDARGEAGRAIEVLNDAVSMTADALWTARFQGKLGELLVDVERYTEAASILEAAAPVLQEKLEPCDPEAVSATVMLAESLAELERSDEAIALLTPICDRCGDVKNPTAGGLLARKSAAKLLVSRERFEDALCQLVEAMAMEEKVTLLSYEIQEPATNVFVEVFANYAVEGNADSLDRVVNFAHEVLGPAPQKEVVQAQHAAGFQLMQSERYDDALRYLQAAMTGVEQLYEADDSNSGATHLLLGETLLYLGRAKEAVGHLEDAVTVAEALFEPDDWRLERAQRLLSMAQGKSG